MFANKSEVLYKCIANRKGSRFGGFLFILFLKTVFMALSPNDKLEIFFQFVVFSMLLMFSQSNYLNLETRMI